MAEYQHENFNVVGKDDRFGGFEVLEHKDPSHSVRNYLSNLAIRTIVISLARPRRIPASSENRSIRVTTVSSRTCMFLFFFFGRRSCTIGLTISTGWHCRSISSRKDARVMHTLSMSMTAASGLSCPFLKSSSGPRGSRRDARDRFQYLQTHVNTRKSDTNVPWFAPGQGGLWNLTRRTEPDHLTRPIAKTD